MSELGIINPSYYMKSKWLYLNTKVIKIMLE